MYEYIRNLLFKLEPERAHHFTLGALNFFYRCKLIPMRSFGTPCQVMGINFPNRVGLAAGLDKNGDYINALAALGFGFIEIGTVTPRPQIGNPPPRLFRLPAAGALINRLGFNNEGVDYLIQRVKASHFKGVLGINIGKNFDTPLENALADYLYGLRKVYPYASYITINISSPNTPGLRTLQVGSEFATLLQALKNEQKQLSLQYDKYVPLVVKISPDLDTEQIQQLAVQLLNYQIDGVIATNTTVSRPNVENLSNANQAGGLSGKPLLPLSLNVVKQLSQLVAGKIPIIALGGIFSSEDARAYFDAGASLVQIYTGFIYQGPHLIKDIVTHS